MPWLTPDDIGPPFTQWGLLLPDSLVKVVRGLLDEAGFATNWEQDGTVTPEEAAEFFVDLSLNFAPSSGGGMPAGIIAWFAGPIPTGWLLCDGSQYDADDYPDLYPALDPVYYTGVDDFFVPDLINRVAIGSGDDYALRDEGGTATQTLVDDNIPTLNLQVRARNDRNILGGGVDTVFMNPEQFFFSDGARWINTPTAFSTVSPYHALRPAIKATND